jgi:hypothetical protein
MFFRYYFKITMRFDIIDFSKLYKAVFRIRDIVVRLRTLITDLAVCPDPTLFLK